MLSEKNIPSKAAESKSEALPELLANSAIHRKYKLGSVLSRDFAGTLYSTAIASQDGRETAVKVLKDGYSLISNIIGGIDHSRICKIRNTIIEHDKIQAVVHEKPRGINLSTYIKEKGPLSVGEAVLAELQLLSAVHAVHWQGAAVGNLHSDSIFLSRDKQGNLELELANLGIGCLKDNLREQDYLAPEQIMGGKAVSKKADIWSTGAIFYEMLTGKRPFLGDNRYAVAGKILLAEISFEGHDGKIPKDLLSFILRAMRKDEKDRFESVSEMVAELMPFQAEFNEPMSEAASSAIHDSVPPAHAAKESRSLPRVKAIPTLRISHTPSSPPIGLGAKKEIESPSAPSLKSKLGVPAISVPAKHIPIKTKEDTASFIIPQFEPSLDLSAYSARKAKLGASSSPAPQDGIPKATRPDLPSLNLLKEMGEVALPLAKSSIVSKIKRHFATGLKIAKGLALRVSDDVKTGSLKQKIIVGAAAFAVLLIIVLMITVSGKKESVASGGLESKASAGLPKPPAKTPKAKPKEAAPPPPSTQAKVVEQAAPSKKVTLSFMGELPKDATIRINDVDMETLPIVLDATLEKVALSITAEGYKPFTVEVVPSEDRTVEVEMTKESAAPSAKPKKVQKSAQPKKKPKKKEKSGNSLASNPFGG